ncbi:hypothetical protein AB0N81_30570 [Streptomyces sp. NPDC093510]|uniref:hypothetical protein n=1 Tax=Streptomyces sp. NPDC093510 TaxID=3155199 RepID=UPI00341C329A
MKRSSAGSIAALILLFPVACTADDEPLHGAAALKSACSGVFDAGSIKEAKKSTKIDQVRADRQEDYPAAARALVDEKRMVKVCSIPFEGDPADGSSAFRIQFHVGDEPLFPRNEKRSTSGYRAYGLKSGLQATSESGSSDVFFPCTPKGSISSVDVTASLYNDLDLVEQTRFRILFRSTEKMIAALKCKNEVTLPRPESMRPFPVG